MNLLPSRTDIQEFRAAVDIYHSLGELYKLQARNRITPRRAAVMAYTCNLLLRTLPAIACDNHPEPQQRGLELDFSDRPEPTDGSGIKGPACYRRAVQNGILPETKKTVVNFSFDHLGGQPGMLTTLYLRRQNRGTIPFRLLRQRCSQK